MKTTRKTRPSPAKVPAEGPEESQENASPSLFDHMGDDSHVLVHRRDDLSKDWVFHGKLTPQEATEEELARVFGGGTYRCQEKMRDPDSGIWRIGRTRTVKLTGPYRPPTGFLPGMTPKDAPQQSAAVTVAPVGAPADIMGAGILQLFQAAQTQQQMMTQMFQQSQQAQSALLQAILKGDGNKGTDFGDIIKALVPVVTAYLAQPKQERDPLEMLKAVGDIVRSNTGKQSDITDTIEAMNALMEMRERLGGSGDGDPFTASIPKLVEVIAEQSQLAKQQKGKSPVATSALGGNAMSSLDQTQKLTVPLWVRVIRGEGPKLLAAAKEGRTPGLVAEVAWEWAPVPVKQAIAEFIQRDDVMDRLYELVPGLQDHREWAEEFVGEVYALIFPDEEGEETADPNQLNLGEEGDASGNQPQG